MSPGAGHGVLVACVGNIFASDDGFGVAVAAALAGRELPEGVRVVDYGIRSVHLVYDVLEGCDVLVLVDTVSRTDGPPGSLFVIEPDLRERHRGGGPEELPAALLDPHDLAPGGAVELVTTLGGRVGRIVVVGVIPGSLEDGIGLGPAVAAAVEPAAQAVLDLIARGTDGSPGVEEQPRRWTG